MKKIRKVAYSFLIGDLFHYGHLKMLEVARQSADYHICGVITDAVTEKWISPRICSFKERKGVVESIRHVDRVIAQDSMDPTRNLMRIHREFPEATLVLVRNHHLWESTLGSGYVMQAGGQMVSHAFYPGLSRERISKAFFSAFADRQNFTGTSFNTIKFGDVRFFKQENVTKANTLRRLRSVLRHAIIEKEFIFTVGQWVQGSEAVLTTILEMFRNRRLVVRSSSLSEDALESSNAGHFRSVIDVRPEREELRSAVHAVIESYRTRGGASGRDQILVQRLTTGVALSGVVFTRNIRTNTPYYLVNYSEGSDRTDAVTSGAAAHKIEVLRSAPLAILERRWRTLLKAIQEIEEYFKGVALDVEFALRADGTVVIFQVRPLAANSRFYSLEDDIVAKRVRALMQRVRAGEPGDRQRQGYCLSDMAFWNPAELVGDRPNVLDTSLLGHLVLWSSWNRALRPLGYTPVDGSLQVLLGNKPYVDVRKAFRTLLPASLPARLAGRLVEHYLRQLRKRPELHDKIEFKIADNCLRFDFDGAAAGLRSHGFTAAEVATLLEHLRTITNGMLTGFPRLARRHDGRIAALEAAYPDRLRRARRAVFPGGLDLVHELLDDCRQNGIMPFVAVARCAFVGSALLRSLERVGALSLSEVEDVLNSVQTVASNLDRDFGRVGAGTLSLGTFMKRYGHLRPGTYDITRLPYRLDPSRVRWRIPEEATARRSRKRALPVGGRTIDAITERCRAAGLRTDGRSLLGFVTRSIELREYYKFVATKYLSLALELIAGIGEAAGFSRAEMAHLDYHTLLGFRGTRSEEQIREIWRSLIRSRQEDRRLDQMVALPPVVFSAKDLLVVSSLDAMPNFVTEQVVEGRIVCLDRKPASANIGGKIVVLEKADPGYDWIFTKPIKALLTKYGGAASHMAIRCAEFGIPAAIGCGELIFSALLNSSHVQLDCASKTVTPR